MLLSPESSLYFARPLSCVWVVDTAQKPWRHPEVLPCGSRTWGANSNLLPLGNDPSCGFLIKDSCPCTCSSTPCRYLTHKPLYLFFSHRASLPLFSYPASCSWLIHRFHHSSTSPSIALSDKMPALYEHDLLFQVCIRTAESSFKPFFPSPSVFRASRPVHPTLK